MAAQSTGFTSLDSRKRANLAAYARHRDYKVTVESDGRIILEPAVVMTEAELRVLENKALAQAVEESRSSGTAERRRGAAS